MKTKPHHHSVSIARGLTEAIEALESAPEPHQLLHRNGERSWERYKAWWEDSRLPLAMARSALAEVKP